LRICLIVRACAGLTASRATERELNENLSPLRRYLERRDKVYSEISAHLRADNTVQQHVRDHLRDFVCWPQRRAGWYFTYPGDRKEPFSRLWYQPLYVDEKDGILKRTDRLSEEKARRRARRKPPSRPRRSRSSIESCGESTASEAIPVRSTASRRASR
jgi:hypothetical protein